MHGMIWQRFAIALQVSTGAKDLSVYIGTVCNICKVLEETGSGKPDPTDTRVNSLWSPD